MTRAARQEQAMRGAIISGGKGTAEEKSPCAWRAFCGIKGHGHSREMGASC